MKGLRIRLQASLRFFQLLDEVNDLGIFRVQPLAGLGHQQGIMSAAGGKEKIDVAEDCFR